LTVPEIICLTSGLWCLINTTGERRVPVVSTSTIIGSSVLSASKPVPEPIARASRVGCITEDDASIAIPVIASSAYSVGPSIGDTLDAVPIRTLSTVRGNILIDTALSIRVPVVIRCAIRWVDHVRTGLSIPVETTGTLRSDSLGAALTVPRVPWIASYRVLIGCAVNSVPIHTLSTVIVVPVQNARLSIPDITALTLGGGTSTTTAFNTDSVLVCVAIVTHAQPIKKDHIGWADAIIAVPLRIARTF
jgi:hypothetical protein